MIGGGFSGGFPRKSGKGKKNEPEGIVQGPTVPAPPISPAKSAADPSSGSPTVFVKPGVVGKGGVDHVEQHYRGSGPRVLPGPKGPQYGQYASAPNAVPEIKENEAVWNGVIHGYSGYAKANREILKRLSPFIKVGIAPDMLWNSAEKDPAIQEMWNHHSSVVVSPRAPRISFIPPCPQPSARVRVTYTMMETEVVHPDMIQVMNENFDECWTPTRWNANTFRRSGLTLPIYTMPLGIDPSIYNPGNDVQMPQGTLMTTNNAGRVETPKGFLFVYVFQPSFRKGLEVLLHAFQEAFFSDQTVGLVLGTTSYSLEATKVLPNRDYPIRVWAVSGGFSEKDLAAMYRACQVYVSTSRGEGWNLPMMEAAACGLPVIVPRTSVHPELVPDGCGLFFESEGVRVFPGAKHVSAWFDGMEFPDYGPNSHKQLVEALRRAKNEYASLVTMGRRYMNVVRSRYTWGIAAKNIADRIKILCQ